MRTILLIVLASFVLALPAKAQRVVLIEEFTGENCDPCADENPELDRLMAANPSKALRLRYQSPIPNAGPIYLQYPTGVMSRMSYYGCYFAPWGEVDGQKVGAPPYEAYVSQIDQANIDAAYAIPPPFKIDLVPLFDRTKDSLTISVKITANQAYSQAQGYMKLRIALLESLHFTTPPGSNGEKDFGNVVRMMYPNASGTMIDSNWTTGEIQTLNIKGAVPTYVNDSNNLLLAAWIQDDKTKQVHQAQYATIGMAPTSINITGGLRSAIVYPNPAREAVVFEADITSAQGLALYITDMAGRIVYISPERQFQAGRARIAIPVSALPQGLYTVHVKHREGTTVATLRIEK